jgi:hypothetical protein
MSSAIVVYCKIYMKTADERPRVACARYLSKAIVDFINDKAMSQYDVSLNIFGIEVKENVGEGKIMFLLRHVANATKEVTHCGPQYRKTRKVVAEEMWIDGVVHVILKYTCGYFFQFVCGCRHILSILDRTPFLDDIFPETLKSYEVVYCQDESFREKCDQRTALMEEHRGIIVKCTLDSIKLNADRFCKTLTLDWFPESTKCRISLARKSPYVPSEPLFNLRSSMIVQMKGIDARIKNAC